MKITIKQVAKLMNKSEQFVRIGMQNGTLPIGCVVKNKSQYSYYISPKLLYEFSGIKLDNTEMGNEQNE